MVRPQFRRAVAALVAVAAMAAAGCSSLGSGSGSSAAAPGGPPEKPDITVAAVPTLDSAGLYIAQDKGFFRQQGLHVRIIPADSSATVLRAQEAGKIDISAGNYVSYIQAAASGTKLRILAAGSVMGPNFQMLMVPANSAITNPAQLQGKRVAVNVIGNIGSLLIDSVLDNNAAWPPQQQVNLVKVPFQDMAHALQTGQVQAAWMPEPFVTEAEETIGAQPLADMDAGTTQNLPIEGYVATQAWVHKYPGTAAAFERALREGQQVASTNTAAVDQGLVRYAGVQANIAPITSPPSFPLVLDQPSIQRVANLMLQFGLLGRGYDTAALTH